MDDQEQKEQQWRSDRHKNKFSKRLKQIILLSSIIIVLMLIGYTTILYGGKLIVDEQKLVIKGPTTIETVDGQVVWSLYDEYRIPIMLEDIPEHVQQAFIAIEDRRFYSHSGVDFKSIMRAVYRDIVARSKVEGASTITQQLAKNLFLTNDKSWLRKTKEVMVALYLERELTKDEILQLYLNAIYFGKGQYGIEAASEKFFSKRTSELTIAEGALLAGIVKAPNGYSPIEHAEKALNRRNIVLNAMYEMEFITEDEKNSAQGEPLNINESVRETTPAVQSFVDLVLKEATKTYNLSVEQLREGGYTLITTVNPTIQQIAYEQFKDISYFPGNNLDDIEGAFVMIDEKTGGIVAAIGGRDYEFSHLNRVEVNRQPGSTMKPIAVYAPALMNGNYEPYTLIPDQLLEWNEGTFRNVDDKYEGVVPLYDAVTYSKNTPTVWLLNQIGIDYAKMYLQNMDINIEDKGLSIALGGLTTGITPINLVESYRTFVHEGKYIQSYTIKEIYDVTGEMIHSAHIEEHDVFSPQVAWTMTEMLKSVVERGTGKSGYYSKELAGKTGTTEHPLVEGYAKDAWFVGYTPQYVFALWMGYDKSTENNYLTGGSAYPTQLTKKILTRVDEQLTLTSQFMQPDGVESVMSPIELPVINDVKGKTSFGGLTFKQGEITWTPATDERIIYRIYKVKSNVDERIGEVTGKGEFIVKNLKLFKEETFYIVPFDPITQLEGKQSNIVTL